MSVVGIDPSLRCTGVAFANAPGTLTAQRFPTKPAATLAEQRDQVRYIVGSVMDWVPASLELTVIEKPYVPQRHGAGDVIERAWLFGLFVDQLMRRGPVVVVSAKGRAKYGSGNGNAEKKEVLAAVRRAFPNIAVRDDNEADAMVLACMGARHLGVPLDGEASKKQLEAMSAVLWPVIERRKN